MSISITAWHVQNYTMSTYSKLVNMVHKLREKSSHHLPTNTLELRSCTWITIWYTQSHQKTSNRKAKTFPLSNQHLNRKCCMMGTNSTTVNTSNCSYSAEWCISNSQISPNFAYLIDFSAHLLEMHILCCRANCTTNVTPQGHKLCFLHRSVIKY